MHFFSAKRDNDHLNADSEILYSEMTFDSYFVFWRVCNPELGQLEHSSFFVVEQHCFPFLHVFKKCDLCFYGSAVEQLMSRF